MLVTFGHSLVWKQSDGGKKPLEQCADGLLVPFLDGMIEAARGKTRLVDGHEMSYGYRDAGAFVQAHRCDQDEGRRAGRRSQRTMIAVVSAGFRTLARLRLAEERLEYRGGRKELLLPRPLRNQPARRPRAIRRICLDLHGKAALVVGKG